MNLKKLLQKRPWALEAAETKNSMKTLMKSSLCQAALGLAVLLQVTLTQAQLLPEPNPTQVKERVALQCGAHTVAITCGRAKPGDPPDNRVCTRNKLSFTDANGKEFVPKQPKNCRQEFFVEKTPTSIDCGQGKDGQYYVTIDFVAGPLGCGPCSMSDLFYESGQRLTVNGRYLDKLKLQHGVPFNKPIYIEEYGP